MKRVGVVAGMLPLVLTAWLSPAHADDPPADQAVGQSSAQGEQSQPQDQGDQPKKTEARPTVTGPRGNSATKDGTVTKDGNTVTRNATLTGPKGKTVTRRDNWTKNGDAPGDAHRSERSDDHDEYDRDRPGCRKAREAEAASPAQTELKKGDIEPSCGDRGTLGRVVGERVNGPGRAQDRSKISLAMISRWICEVPS